MSRIADISLAPSGEIKINWVERNMPVLRALGEDFKKTKPFEGLRIALSVHLEAKTAYLCRVLEMGGAEMYVTGSNPLSTQDDVAAALAAGGMQVFPEIRMKRIGSAAGYGAELVFAHLDCGQREIEEVYGESFQTLFLKWHEAHHARCEELGIRLG